MSPDAPATPETPSPRHAGLPRALVFRRRHRLSGGPAFRAVFEGKLRRSRGSLTIYFRENQLPEPRLGLSVGRKVGSAVQRARWKRLVREAFRLERSALPAGPAGSYDLVVVVRPGSDPRLDVCRSTLRDLAREAHDLATSRRAKARARHTGSGGSDGA